jgi:hypothetical protein
MRRVFVLLSTVATLGALILLFGVNNGSTLRPGTAAVPYPPPTQTAIQGQTSYPGPRTPNPVYPTVLVPEQPTAISGTPPGGFPTEAPFATETRAVPTITPTFGPLPAPSPVVIDPNVPTPTDYPPQLPREGAMIVSEANGWPMDKLVDSMTYVLRGRVARIDPPFWSSEDGKRPPFIHWYDITTPALLNVEEVYKGPYITTLEIGLPGLCFAPTACTEQPTQYSWGDVVGYDLILFIVQQLQVPGRPLVPTHAYPFSTYVVHPNAARDELLAVSGTGRATISRSKLEASIRSAPTANH